MSQNHWATQSPVTEPGPAGKVIDELPDDLAALRQASSQLVFHYRAGGDFTANGVPPGRMAEIDTRYADLMLDRILERGAPTLARARAGLGLARQPLPLWMIDFRSLARRRRQSRRR
jgi:hypothetical protein